MLTNFKPATFGNSQVLTLMVQQTVRKSCTGSYTNHYTIHSILFDVTVEMFGLSQSHQLTTTLQIIIGSKSLYCKYSRGENGLHTFGNNSANGELI